MATFVEKLDAAARRNQSLLCVGLDPVPAQMPIDDTVAFCKAIFVKAGEGRSPAGSTTVSITPAPTSVTKGLAAFRTSRSAILRARRQFLA